MAIIDPTAADNLPLTANRPRSKNHHAIAIRREDGTLALFLRVVRNPNSGIYVAFAAGQERAGHDAHA
jgi:hypothetical protein